MLVAQQLLYRTLSSGATSLAPMTDLERRSLDWRPAGEQDDISETVTVAEAFVGQQLETLQTRLAT